MVENGVETLLSKAEFSGHEFLVGADFTPALGENFRLVVGPYLGLSLLKASLGANVGGEYYSESQTQKGFIIGGHLGFLVDTAAGRFEAGLKADQAWHHGSGEWPDFDKSTFGGYVGYNYKFD